MNKEVDQVIKKELSDYSILSLTKFVDIVAGYRRSLVKECDGFSIWGVFSHQRKIVCLYTQDSKAKIKFYDPVTKTLNNVKK